MNNTFHTVRKVKHFAGILFLFIFTVSLGFPKGFVVGVIVYIFLMKVIPKIIKDDFMPQDNSKQRKYKSSQRSFHTREIKVNLTLDETFELCIKSSNLIPFCTIKHSYKHTGGIIALINWEEGFNDDLLEFKLSKLSSNMTHVKVSCEIAHDKSDKLVTKCRQYVDLIAEKLISQDTGTLDDTDFGDRDEDTGYAFTVD